VQSNSQRQVAAAAAQLGLACHLAVYHGRVAPQGPAYGSSGNALLNRLFGATLHDVPWTGDRNGAIAALVDRLRQDGRRPFLVPYGVSSPLGAVGYASAGLEIAEQCAAQGFAPAAIVFCSGSGATQAGLAVAAAACLPGTAVVGIDIDAEPERVRADVARYALGAALLLGLEFDPATLEVVAGHAGPAYGVPHAATLEALHLAARQEALVLDPVYSAKGLAGLIALLQAGRWGAGEDVVFVHTGGAPSVFAHLQ
jgi:L-cysteate sulfo-lyase